MKKKPTKSEHSSLVRNEKVSGHYRSTRATRKQIRALLNIIGQPENQARPSYQARKIYTPKKDPRPIFYVLGQLKTSRKY